MNEINVQGNINIKSNGYYSINVINKNGDIVDEKTINSVQNTVTTAGAYYSLFGEYTSNIFRTLYCRAGTGTTERTVTSADLGNRLEAISNGVGVGRAGNEVDNLDGTSTITVARTFTFGLGAIVGTISEVGLYNTTSATSFIFIAGQLIKDEFGNPTTITLLADEQLQVTYVLEWTVPNVATLAASGTTVINTVSTNYELWVQPYFAAWGVGSTKTTTNWIHFSNRDQLSLVNSSYNRIFYRSDLNATLFRDGNQFVHRSRELVLAPSDFSSSDIKGFVFTGHLYYTISIIDGRVTVNSDPDNFSSTAAILTFDPPLVKTSDDTLRLQAEFRVTF